MRYAGIDAGSRAIKIVLLDGATGAVAARGACDQGVHQEELAAGLLEELRREAGGEALGGMVATGYGRAALSFAGATVTEITCHARGVRALVPEVRTLVDIGGQDSKVIWFDGQGAVRDFLMNDRCAAGTGRFMELVATRLGAGLNDLGPMAARSTKPVVISSTCVVFAETEIVGLLAQRAQPEDLVAGVQRSIATRMASMIGRRVLAPVVFTGGVARVPGMADALAAALGCAVRVAPDPQYTGALGAALLAAEEGAKQAGGGARTDRET